MTPGTGAWRTLTADELAAEPDARFGGAIAVIFFAALLLLITLSAILVFVAVWFLTAKDDSSAWIIAFMRMGFGSGGRAAALSYYTVMQTLAPMVWAAAYVVSTIFRARSGATISAVLFAVCTLLGPAYWLVVVPFTPGGAALVMVATQLPHLIPSFVAAVAYWVYMREGRRPNLYFGRRVRV
jgi:hypothetical protein